MPTLVPIYGTQMLDWQRRAANDPHRFKVLVAGRKARKTTFMVNELCFGAMQDPRGLVYLYVAPFRQQGKEIVWGDHLTRILHLCESNGIKYHINNSELWVDFYSGSQKMSRFQVSGADNAEALRGKSNWAAVGLDEYAKWKPWIWQEIIRPNLQVHKAWAIFGSSPYGYNHFYETAKLGDHNHVIDSKATKVDRDFITFHASSYDNKYIDVAEIESAKRNTTVDYFNQEYLALFTRFTGLVYPEFEISNHVSHFEHLFNAHGEYIFGMDFAVRGFTAALSGFIDTKGEIWILDEYKMEKATAKEHAPAIEAMLVGYGDFSKYVGYADPAGWRKDQQRGEMIWSIADEYLEEDFPITQANNEVVAGINYVRQLLKSGRLHIHARCVKLIEEIVQYQWKDQPENQIGLRNQPEEVKKYNDHLVDCLRYMLYSKPETPASIAVAPDTIFPLTFPPPRIEEPDPDMEQITPMEIPSLMDEQGFGGDFNG